MPLRSQAQAHLFGMVAGGVKKLPGLSKKKAIEFFRETPSVKALPKKA